MASELLQLVAEDELEDRLEGVDGPVGRVEAGQPGARQADGLGAVGRAERAEITSATATSMATRPGLPST